MGALADLRAFLERERPYWADERLRAWPGDAHLERRKRFLRTLYWSDSATVNVRLVVGTDHPHFQGMSWAWLLEHAPGISMCLRLLDENPDYYLGEAQRRPPIRWVSMDGHSWYVWGSGYRRTCIARFYLEMLGRCELHGVSVLDHRFDEAMEHAFARMEEVLVERRIPARIEAHARKVAREDGPGWHLDRCEPEVTLRWRGRVWRARSAEACARMLDWLRSSRFRRWFFGGFEEEGDGGASGS